MMPAMHTYLQIREEMVRQIESGHYHEGQRLPSEYEMSELFGVSRMTWRNAQKVLVADGYLSVRRGSGTYVIRSVPKVANNLQEVQSLTDLIKAAGIHEEKPLVSIRHERADETIAARLQISAGDTIAVLDRTRFARGEAIIHTINYLCPFPGFSITKSDLHRSLLQYYEDKYNIHIALSQTEICVPVTVDPNVTILKITPDTPVILLRQTHYDSMNYPVFYSLDYLRNDIFRFMVNRRTP